jgi:hypothetical protein
MAVTGTTLCTDVLVELGVYGPTQTPNPKDINVVLGQLTRLVDNWNADQQAIYADQFLTFTLTPSLQPHTIGPSGATWTTAQRPVSIEDAQLIVSSSQTYPITLREADWWNSIVNTGYTTDLPTDLYYSPTWPNGSLYFYGEPTAAYDVQLLCRGILSAYTLTTAFSMPPGYRDAMTLTLKEMCADAFAKTLSEKAIMDASKARARIFTNNTVIPKLTSDAGLPGRDGSGFDYVTRTRV